MKAVYSSPCRNTHALLIFAAVLFLSLCATSCLLSHRRDSSRAPKMSKENVIAIAGKTAESAGYALSDYKQPEAYFELTARDRTWTVFFEESTPSRKGNFQVWINDNNGTAEVMTGK